MQPIAFLQNLNAPEIIMIFLVVLLFFGAKRLPELFRSLGKSLREFKKATSDIEDDIRTAMEEEPEHKKATQPPAKKEATTDPRQVEAKSDTDDNEPEYESDESGGSETKSKQSETTKA